MRKMNIWKKGPPVCSLPGRAECCGERPLWEGEEVRGEVRQWGDHLHPPGSGHSWGLASCCPGCHHQAWPSACQECGQGGGGLHSPPKAETGSAFGSGQCRSPLCQDTNLPWPRSGWRCWWAIDYDQTFTLMRYQSKNPLYYRFLPLNTHEGLRVDCKLYGTIRWCVQWWQIQDRITKHCNWKIPISNDKTTNFSVDILNINFIV